MRRNQHDELSRSNHLGSFPVHRKMRLVAGHQIVGERRVGIFEERVVAGVRRDAQSASGNDRIRVTANELDPRLPQTSADLQLRPRQHILILKPNRSGHVPSGRLGHRQQQDSTLEPVRFEGRRYNNVGVHDPTKRNHLRRILVGASPESPDQSAGTSVGQNSGTGRSGWLLRFLPTGGVDA